jgi:hypothetical protein
VTLATETSQKLSCKTTWTLLLYLTSEADGCTGGETVFYPNDRRSRKEEIAVELETGMLLLHKHGEDCMLVCRPPICVSRSLRPDSFSRPIADMGHSMREEKSQQEKSGCYERTFVSKSEHHSTEFGQSPAL